MTRRSEREAKANRAYWALRVAETGLLVTALGGIALFAWSLVDIIRIETAAGATAAATEIPPSAWPGVFTFLASMVLLQVVRVVLHRYRRADGSPRGDERGAVSATEDALIGVTVPFEALTEDEDDVKDA